MNDHDRDLIIALAAGSLDDEAAEEARSRVSSDPELAAALAEQMSVRRHLTAMEPVTMTGDERQALRSNLSTELHLDATPVRPPLPRRRSVRWWQPVLGFAAAAFVIGAIAVIPGMSGSDSADEAALTTITPAAEIPVVGAESDGATDSAGGADEPRATTEVLSFEDVDGSDLLSVTEGQSDPAEMSDAIEQQLDAKTRSSLDLGAVERCLEQLAAEIPDGDTVVLGEILGSEEGDNGLIVFLGVIDQATGLEAVVTIDVTACEVLDIDR